MEEKSIHILIANLPDTSEQVFNWIDRELGFWNLIYTALDNSVGILDTEAIYKYIERLRYLFGTYNKTEKIESEKLKKILDNFSKTLLPHHTDLIAEKISLLSNKPDGIAQILFTYTVSRHASEDILKNQYFSEYSQIIQRGVSQIEGYSENYSKIHENTITSIESSRVSLTSHAEHLKSEALSGIEKACEEQKATISELSSSIQKEIRSNEPVKFWEGKEKHHQTHAKSCRRAAIALGSCASVALSLLIFAAFKDQDTTLFLGFKIPNHFYIAVSIIVGSAFIWALKISIQLMMTHVALEAEALEKSTAIKTYVALSNQIKDPDIEREFHKALLTFNKIKIAEDSNNPELLKLVEQFLTRKKDS